MIKLSPTVILYVLAFFGGASIAFAVQSLRWEADVSAINLAHDESLKKISDKALVDLSEANERANKANSLIAALDDKHTSELSNALANNQKLADDVAAGSRRVRMATADLATCQLSKATTSGTGSLGNATQVELTRTAGQNILDIRSGIISDQAKLEYLQGYVKTIEEAKNGNIPK
ncbi:lysis system i-spanin subunit Rz [Rouxiella sp. Mn2063]|uniref:lysis system i-spanin subunit Rz n=1 Tax=Rouxiella sp. Mn2063 TaxID=3395262 RepID=UPI003BCB924E